MPPPSRPAGNAGRRDDPDRPKYNRDGARRNRHRSQHNEAPPLPPRNHAGNNPPGPPSPPSSDHEGSRRSHGSRRGRGSNGERRSRNPTPPRRSREPPRHRSLSPNDARHRIESNIEVWRYEEEDVYVGPKCFGPRIRQTKFLIDFGITKHIQPYDGAARPDTWLQDFSKLAASPKEETAWSQ